MLTAALAGALAAIVLVAATERPRGVPPRCGDHRSPAHERAPIDYAACLDAMSRRVRTGSSLSAAIVDTKPSGELAAVVAAIEAGDGLTDALAAMHGVDGDLALTVQAMSAAARLGGPVAATLDGAAAVLRERAAARAERTAHSAQARLSARVLTVVPLAFTAWNLTSNATSRTLFLSNFTAGTCAAAGLVLNLAGWQWMRKIVGPP